MNFVNNRNYILYSLVFLLAGLLNTVVAASFYDVEGFITIERGSRNVVVWWAWVFLVIEIIWIVFTLVMAYNEIKLVLAKKGKVVVAKKVAAKKKAKRK